MFESLTGFEAMDLPSLEGAFDDKPVYAGVFGGDANTELAGFADTRAHRGDELWGTMAIDSVDSRALFGCGCGEGGLYADGFARGTLGGGQGHRHVAAVPEVAIKAPILIGDVATPIIRRYIKRNLEKIQYCYDQRLLGDKALAGDITVSFFIAADGSVTAASATGFDDGIGTCVASVIKAIEFPRLPHDSGGVQVTYPFTFRTGR
jgi:hypothetical protein